MFSVHSHLLVPSTTPTECPLFYHGWIQQLPLISRTNTCALWVPSQLPMFTCRVHVVSTVLLGLRLNTTMLGWRIHAPYSGGCLPRYQSVAQPVVQPGVKQSVLSSLHTLWRSCMNNSVSALDVSTLFRPVISNKEVYMTNPPWSRSPPQGSGEADIVRFSPQNFCFSRLSPFQEIAHPDLMCGLGFCTCDNDFSLPSGACDFKINLILISR